MSNLAHNKATVVAFYGLLFNDCRPCEAIERYVGAEYIQHNPHVATVQGRLYHILRAHGVRTAWQAGRGEAGCG